MPRRRLESEPAGRQTPSYTQVMAAELVRIGTEDDARRRRHGRHAHGHGRRHASARRSRGGPVRRRHRRAARDDARDGPRARRPASRSSRSTRPSCSAPSTRSSTTSARTTRPVVIGIDRAGLVGEDGTSHQGMFTLERAAPAAQPRDGRAARRAAGSAVCCAPRSARHTPSRIQYPRDPGWACATGRADARRDRQRRGAGGGAGHPRRRARADRRARAARWPSGCAARAGRWRSSTRASSGRSTRTCSLAQARGQAPRRDARGEHAGRRLRLGRAGGAGGRPPAAAGRSTHRHPDRAASSLRSGST